MNRILLISIVLFTSFRLDAQIKSKPYALMIDNLIDKSVPLISCETLSNKMEVNDNLIILDAREKEEFDVSHIPGAIWTGYSDFSSRRLDGVSRQADLIVYCSVGYRSEKIAEQLSELGFDKFYNLHGGIFEWVNQGYDIVNNRGESTEEIHAYDKIWSVWLNKGEKVYE